VKVVECSIHRPTVVVLYGRTRCGWICCPCYLFSLPKWEGWVQDKTIAFMALGNAVCRSAFIPDFTGYLRVPVALKFIPEL
jgi:hypothetical protein